MAHCRPSAFTRRSGGGSRARTMPRVARVRHAHRRVLEAAIRRGPVGDRAVADAGWIATERHRCDAGGFPFLNLRPTSSCRSIKSKRAAVGGVQLPGSRSSEARRHVGTSQWGRGRHEQDVAERLALSSRLRKRELREAAQLRPLKRDVVGDIGNVLWVSMVMVGTVLLIACANVANLLLVRAEQRRQEWGPFARALA